MNNDEDLKYFAARYRDYYQVHK